MTIEKWDSEPTTYIGDQSHPGSSNVLGLFMFSLSILYINLSPVQV